LKNDYGKNKLASKAIDPAYIKVIRSISLENRA
jgi:hypothetical protein